MAIAKRILLFLLTNLLVLLTISITFSILGITSYLSDSGIDYYGLMVFCLIWGMAGAFISLMISRITAKWFMGVKLIDDRESNSALSSVRNKVANLAKQQGLPMPEVGYYNSPEANAFATGPTKNRSLVAVSSGLLETLNDQQVEGVLAHEISHIANGDMVTMTLIQGIVNAFVMFFARVLAWIASNFFEDAKQLVNIVVRIVAEIVLSILGWMLVAAFSRAREFRADAGAADLAGKEKMISALEALKATVPMQRPNEHASLTTLMINGKPSRFAGLFSTHPDLSERIEALRKS